MTSERVSQRLKKQRFRKGDEIRLDFGAVIVPFIQANKSSIAIPKLIEFLEKARWTRCKFQRRCIDATEDFDGFSCEVCPLRGKQENARVITEEDAAHEAENCARLLDAAFRDG